MANTLSDGTLVVVATGTLAKTFRAKSHHNGFELKQEVELGPTNLAKEGPSGSRPIDVSPRENDEATFSKQVAEYLYREAHAGTYSHLVLVADPETLGEMRPQLHQVVKGKIVVELAKTLINSPAKDIAQAIQKSLSAESPAL